MIMCADPLAVQDLARAEKDVRVDADFLVKRGMDPASAERLIERTSRFLGKVSKPTQWLSFAKRLCNKFLDNNKVGAGDFHHYVCHQSLDVVGGQADGISQQRSRSHPAEGRVCKTSRNDEKSYSNLEAGILVSKHDRS